MDKQKLKNILQTYDQATQPKKSFFGRIKSIFSGKKVAPAPTEPALITSLKKLVKENKDITDQYLKDCFLTVDNAPTLSLLFSNPKAIPDPLRVVSNACFQSIADKSIKQSIILASRPASVISDSDQAFLEKTGRSPTPLEKPMLASNLGKLIMLDGIGIDISEEIKQVIEDYAIPGFDAFAASLAMLKSRGILSSNADLQARVAPSSAIIAFLVKYKSDPKEAARSLLSLKETGISNKSIENLSKTFIEINNLDLLPGLTDTLIKLHRNGVSVDFVSDLLRVNPGLADKLSNLPADDITIISQKINPLSADHAKRIFDIALDLRSEDIPLRPDLISLFIEKLRQPQGDLVEQSTADNLLNEMVKACGLLHQSELLYTENGKFNPFIVSIFRSSKPDAVAKGIVQLITTGISPSTVYSLGPEVISAFEAGQDPLSLLQAFEHLKQQNIKPESLLIGSLKNADPGLRLALAKAFTLLIKSNIQLNDSLIAILQQDKKPESLAGNISLLLNRIGDKTANSSLKEVLLHALVKSAGPRDQLAEALILLTKEDLIVYSNYSSRYNDQLINTLQENEHPLVLATAIHSLAAKIPREVLHSQGLIKILSNVAQDTSLCHDVVELLSQQHASMTPERLTELKKVHTRADFSAFQQKEQAEKTLSDQWKITRNSLVKTVLDTYGREKGLMRSLKGEHASIRSLRDLQNTWDDKPLDPLAIQQQAKQMLDCFPTEKMDTSPVRQEASGIITNHSQEAIKDKSATAKAKGTIERGIESFLQTMAEKITNTKKQSFAPDFGFGENTTPVAPSSSRIEPASQHRPASPGSGR